MSIQPMPDLNPEQYDALRRDIAEHGVRVPITRDQHGRILDGNNRATIAADLGVDVPEVVVQVADDDEAHDVAVTLNCARRHLTQEQQRHLIRAELRRRFGESDRSVARRVGCSPTTVGTVRREMRAEAEERTRAAREEMSAAATATSRAALDVVKLGGDLEAIIDGAGQASETAAERMRELAHDERPEQVVEGEAWARASMAWYVFTTLHNDLGDIASDLSAAGWEGCPQQVPDEQLESLTNKVFALSNLDTDGGAR